MTKDKEIKARIKSLKLLLIKKAKKKGLYENFGQKEVRKLRDTFIDISSYTEEMNQSRDLIQDFDKWCMNFDDSQLN